MEVNGMKFGITVLPLYGNVVCEVWMERNIGSKGHLVQKSFGSCFRKPVELDYVKARKWGLQQLLYIMDSNKPV